MNVIHTSGYPEDFSVICNGVSVQVQFDTYSKSFQILYLNPNYNSHAALHLGINTIKDAEALRDALTKAITHAKEEKVFEKTLRTNKRVLKNGEELKSGQTHAIIKKDGATKIVRKRFSAT